MITMLLLTGLLSLQDNFPTKDIPGTYVRKIQKHSKVRQFGRSLILNCDSTALATFQGDMMNEKIRGRWKMHGDTLKVILDSTYQGRPYGHWGKENLFLIQKKRLLNIVTEINGKKIRDKQIIDAMLRDSKKYAYKRTKKQSCD